MSAGTGVRLPPHNFEAEQALLGALMLNNRTYDKVADFLRPDHFADPGHGRIYDSCAKLFDIGKSATPVTLASYLEKDPLVIDLGGSEYLAQLAGSVISTLNVSDYGQLIFDLHLRREGILICEDAIDEFYTGTRDAPASKTYERMEHRAAQAMTAVMGDDRTKSAGDSYSIALTQIEASRQARLDGRMVGVTTGLIDLDKATGGLRRSDLIILAGRPSQGKTGLALNIAVNAAKAGNAVLFASLEMSHEQLTLRTIAAESGVPSNLAEQGDVTDWQFDRILSARDGISGLPLYIDDTCNMNPQGLKTRARRIKRKHGLNMIVVDYLQLMHSVGKSENRTQEVSELTRSLKGIARELDVPVLVLSQLSRAVESRDDKRPMLSDLRESGSIEQDADVVMFIYREQYYLERAEPGRKPSQSQEKHNDAMAVWNSQLADVKNKAEVIIAKQRRGPVGTKYLHFDPTLVKFSNLAQKGF